jgi:hypothetical protein
MDLIIDKDLIHTEDISAYNRADECIVETFLTDYLQMPLGCIEGELPEFNGERHRRKLLECHPTHSIPPLVPRLDIVLPLEVVVKAIAMAQGVNPEDTYQALERAEAQEAFRESRRAKICKKSTTQCEDNLSGTKLQDRNAKVKYFVGPFRQVEHLLVKKVINAEDYQSVISGPQQTYIRGIIPITRLSDTDKDPDLTIEQAKKHLRSVKMRGSCDVYAFNQRFKESCRAEVQEGERVENAVLIEYQREGLHEVPSAEHRKNHRVLHNQFVNVTQVDVKGEESSGVEHEFTKAQTKERQQREELCEKPWSRVIGASSGYSKESGNDTNGCTEWERFQKLIRMASRAKKTKCVSKLQQVRRCVWSTPILARKETNLRMCT